MKMEMKMEVEKWRNREVFAQLSLAKLDLV